MLKRGRQPLRGMGRIAITDGLSSNAVDVLRDEGHSVIEEHISAADLCAGALSDFDALIVRGATKITQAVLESAAGGNLKVIARAGVGVDNIDLAAATAAGILVVNAPGASTQSVAEMAMGHLLSCVRRLMDADRSLRRGEWAKKRLQGSELAGKNLGLFGYGRIARAVASRARAFEMVIHAYDPYLPEIEFGEEVIRHEDIESLFSTCTHISIHCNLSQETERIVGTDLISLMPIHAPDGVRCGNHIVNCARGGIVDELAALAALESGELDSLALDVFETEPLDSDHPLLRNDGFHGTPHIGASTIEAQSRVGLETVGMVLGALRGEAPTNLVNRDVLQDA